MSKRSYPLSKVCGLLEPGPVVLLSTADRAQRNIMTMSWLMPIEFEPPQLACVVSNANHSYGLLKRTRECAINIPTDALADEVVGVGNCSGRDTDKFRAFGLTAKPAALVGAPIIAECYANLECTLTDTRMVRRYGIFVLQVVKAWVDTAVKAPRTLHHRGRGQFAIASETLRLRSRMK